MVCSLILPILLAQTPAPIEHRYAETIFATGFEQVDDANYDGWPDKWTRRRGIGFPQYVHIGIDDSASERSLRIDLDGGGATAYSPPIKVSSQFSYTLQGKVKTAGLTYDKAYLSISFFDAERQPKETYTSEKLVDARQWRQLQIGRMTPSSPDIRWAVIGLHLTPTEKADLTGSAQFDDIRFARLPNMSIKTGRPYNLFPSPGSAEITCTVSGIQQSTAIILFELIDVSGRVLLSEQRQLSPPGDPAEALMWPAETDSATPDSTAAHLAAQGEPNRGGSVTWHPTFPDYGFYRIRASLRSDEQLTLQQSTPVAVLRDLGTQRENEFGWSLTRNSHSLSDDDLLDLLAMVHASWVKYPIWYGPEDDAAEGERIANLADRLSATGIEMVGVFDRPPTEVFRRFGDKEFLSVAEAFLEPDMWQPAIDPLMIRLSLKIRWWQLGADDDKSFIDYQALEQKVREIRAHLKKFGQRVRLGLAWCWMHETPQSPQPPWDFLAMTESPSFTNRELATYAEHADTQGAKNWVTLWPLPQGEYDYQARAQDLVLRMLQAKIDGVPAIFAADPFDATRGLLNADGTPDELLLPWCVTAKMLGGAEYLGSLQLPHSSSNHVFAVDNQAVMVVWNKRPATETLYLGDQVVQVDPWGRETTLSGSQTATGEPQVVSVGPLPTFVRGLNLDVTRWRLNFHFEPARLASMFGRRQPLRYQFKNTLSQGVGGTLELVYPDVWEVRSPHLRFKLGTNDEIYQDLTVLLHANASSGPQDVRVDFDLFSDKQYRFSVFRKVHVGLGDVLAELDTWLDDDGRLIVEQHLINLTSDKLDFNCYLFVPGRRRMRIQVFDIGPGLVTHTFALSNGKELLGKSLWLRVEELGGGRLQNYHVVAKP